MNVLLFSTIFPSSTDPIRGLYNLRTFEPLATLCSVRVVSPTSVWKRLWRPFDWFSAPRESHNGLEAAYPTYVMLPRFAPGLHAFTLYASIRSHVMSLDRKWPIDVIVGVFAYPDVVAASKLAADLGIPLIAIVVGSDINALANHSALREQIRDALARAAFVVAVSRGLRDKVVDLGIPASRVVVQLNGVEGHKFSIRDAKATKLHLGFPPDRRLLCFVGNLVKEKGPDLLVEAVRDLDDVHAVFIGDGDLTSELQSRVAALGMNSRVTFLGRQLPAQVSEWLSACDALCLPSRREGCPNVVLEALASGRPVVAAVVGGVPELISKENGILVTPDNVESLKEGIAAVLSRQWDPTTLRRSVPALSWMDVAVRLHGLLTQAVESHQRATTHFTPSTSTM